MLGLAILQIMQWKIL